jgi:hypothetical protein
VEAVAVLAQHSFFFPLALLLSHYPKSKLVSLDLRSCSHARMCRP